MAFGRPHLDEVVKLRRAALRQKLRVDEMRIELEVLGDNADEIEAMSGPGARPKSRSVRLEDEKVKLDAMVEAYKKQEEAGCVDHVPLDKVHDPLVENALPVGRPEKDEFGELDRKLSLAERKLIDVMRSWEQAGDIYPPAVGETTSGKRKGRKPKPFSQRAQELQTEINGIREQLKKLESGLSPVGLMRRQLKVLRDLLRDHKKSLKDAGATAEELKSHPELEPYKRQIKHVNALLADDQKRRANGLHKVSGAVEHKMPMVPAIDSKLSMLDNLVLSAEQKIAEAGEEPADQVVTAAEAVASDAEDLALLEKLMAKEQEELEKKQAYLDLLKKKKALQKEIERMERELKAGE